MNSTRIRGIVLSLVASLLACGSAHAGLFRAYLSSTGSDSNPCTVSAPCRLLPAALGVVNDGGDIWILDSANYNAAPVTVTKSVTILAIPGAVGSLVGAGTSVITVNTAGVNLTLRNLVIEPFSSPFDGVVMTAGASLTIDHCVISGMPNRAVSVATAAVLRVHDSVLRDGNYGVVVENGARGEVSGTKLTNFSVVGAYARGTTVTNTTTKLTVSDSVFQGQDSGTGAAVLADSNDPSTVTTVSLMRSVVSNYGIGAWANGSSNAAYVVVSQSVLSQNGTGMQQQGSAVMTSFGNNTVSDAIFPTLGTISSVTTM